MILTGIIMVLTTYYLGAFLQKKPPFSHLNPLLFSMILCIIILRIGNISFDQFNKGGRIISLFLPPATASLALSIYRQRHLLRSSLIPVIAGCFTGSLSSILSILLLCRLFGFSSVLTRTLLPKSVTTPIAMDISRHLGGIPSITVAAVIVTGITGNLLCSWLIRCLNIGHPSASGIAIGTSSHAIGTAKALELGEIQGAMSGIAIGISGILTVILSLFL